MKPVKPIVPGMNLPVTVMGANQSQYEGLPSFRNIDGVILSRWRPTFLERLCLVFGGSVYLWTHTFNQPLQPVRLDVGRPTRESLGAAASLYRKTLHDERAARNARTIAVVALIFIVAAIGVHSVFASSRLCVESPRGSQESAMGSGSSRASLRGDHCPPECSDGQKVRVRFNHRWQRATIIGDWKGTDFYVWARMRFAAPAPGPVTQTVQQVANLRLIFRDCFTLIDGDRSVTVRATTELCSAPAGHDECPSIRLTKKQITRLDKVLASLKSAVAQ